MVFVIEKDELGHIGFNAGKARKRAARMLAAKLDFEDVTELLKNLLDERIAKVLPDEMREIRAEDLKASTQRQGKRQAASSR